MQYSHAFTLMSIKNNTGTKYLKNIFYFTDALETGNHCLGGKEKGWPWLLKAKKKQLSDII